MQKENDKDIIIYSKWYPYGVSEPFLHDEVVLLSEKFKKVYICPLVKTGEKKRDLPLNVEVLELPQIAPSSRFRAILHSFVLSCNEKERKLHFKHFKFVVNYYRNIFRFKKFIEKFVKEKPGLVHYSYWVEDWAVLLSLLKSKLKFEFTCRAHGFDVYSERWIHKFIPFRSLQLKNVQRIIFVSDTARIYMEKTNPEFVNKFAVSKLGTHDHGEGKIPEGETFIVVSCSNVIPIKRVEVLAEALDTLDFKINWIHIGGGKNWPALNEKTKHLGPHITVKLTGEITNEEILKFYSENAVDVFVLLSQTEGGVPVSLQEAASFGIPLVGTNAGGIPEIVNTQTGILIGNNCLVNDVSSALKRVKQENMGRNVNFRSGVRDFWVKNHDIQRNFQIFNELLTQKPI
ncbi:MAG TPA: glycosyltransferase [Flavobacteriales bacterium]|nr:glycosyltransferase [Flavobacteriales bacterium]